MANSSILWLAIVALAFIPNTAIASLTTIETPEFQYDNLDNDPQLVVEDMKIHPRDGHIEILTEEPEKSYALQTVIVDLQEIAMTKANAIKFLEDAEVQNKQYTHDTFTTSTLKNWEDKLLEFSIGHTKLTEDDCYDYCAIFNATIPRSLPQVWAGLQTLEDNRPVWSHYFDYTRKISTYEFVYRFEINGTQIYPFKNGTGMKPCKLIENNRCIQDIGYYYQWWQQGSYHVTNAKKVTVAVDRFKNCRIHVTTPTHFNSRIGKEVCMCMRPTKEHFIGRQTQVDNLQHALDLSEIGMEPWRIRKAKDNSPVTLDSISIGQLKPRFINHNETDILRKRYLTMSDIAKLEIGQEQTAPIKGLLKSVAKKIITPENVMNMVKHIIKAAKHKKTVNSTKILGNDRQFNSLMVDKDYKVRKTGRNIKVSPKQSIDFNTMDLSHSKIEETKALNTVNKFVLQMDNWENKILPRIIDNIRINPETLGEDMINTNQETTVLYYKHASYIEIRCIIPIIKKKLTSIINVAPIPLMTVPQTNQVVIRDLPTKIRLPLEFASATACIRQIVKESKTTNCPKKTIPMPISQEIATVKNYSIVALRMQSVNILCPAIVKNYKLKKEINIFMIHSSCTVTSYDEKNQMTRMPKTTFRPTVGAKFLLAYNLDKNWMPSRKSQFYMSLGTLITTIALIVVAIFLIIMYIRYKPQIVKLIKPQSDLVTVEQDSDEDMEYKLGSQYFRALSLSPTGLQYEKPEELYHTIRKVRAT